MTRPLHFSDCFEGALAPAKDAPLTIPRCKVLGMESRWGRKFTDAALQDAVTRGIYEGLPIYRNHPSIDYSDPLWDRKPLPPRDVEDVLGFVENVSHEPGKGLFGDVRFTVDDRLTHSVCESATLNPRLYGFSHHAHYESHFEGTTEIVDRILDVHSVDLVTKPATTNGLFEGNAAMSKDAKAKTPKTVKQVLESACLVGIAKKVIQGLEQEPYMNAPVPMEGEVSLEDQISAAFRSAAMAIFDDPNSDDKGKLGKLKDLFAAKAKLNGEESPAKAEGEAPPETPEGEKKEKTESAPPTVLGTTEALTLLEKHKLPITKPALEAYAVLPLAAAEAMAAREVAAIQENDDLKKRLALAGDQKPKSITRLPALEGNAPAATTADKEKPWRAFCNN